jgi:hypothetical protein
MCAGALLVREFVVILQLNGPRAFYHRLNIVEITVTDREYLYRKTVFLSQHWHPPWLS